MKGSGPADRLRKIPKLTPSLIRFIEGMGTYFVSQGIPRIGGRMLGLLMIAHWPLSAEDLASILHISRGSVSTNLRLLLSSGLAERAHLPGSRVTHFAYADDAMEHRIASGVKGVQSFRRLLEQAAESVPPRDPARHHIDDSLAMSDILLEAFEHAMQHWKARHLGRPHLHAVSEGAQS